MEPISMALLGLLAMISAVTSATVVPRTQTQQQEFEAGESALNRQFQSSEAATARQFQSNEAALQRSFEEEMSSTSYQRAVQDMKAAGLNPASIGLGLSGSSTPTGASAASVGFPTGSMGHSLLAQHNDYFNSIFNTAANVAMAKDRNFMNKTIAEMYASNARQMNEVTNATKKILKNSYKVYTYNDDGKLQSTIDSTSAYNPVKPYKHSSTWK